MKIGVDIDGVLCEREVTRTPEDCVGADRTGLEVPSESHEVYVVSSRTGNMKEKTEEWLAENRIEHEKLVLCDVENFEGLSKEEIDRKQASFKARAINELELGVYVEDRPDVRKQLREHCPNCVVLSPAEAQKIWRFSVYEAD